MEHERRPNSPLTARGVVRADQLRGKPLGVLFPGQLPWAHAFTADHPTCHRAGGQAAVRDRQRPPLQGPRRGHPVPLEALANAVDARDPYTAGHSERVTKYALMIARQMHYSPQDQGAWVRLERGGRLHDIARSSTRTGAAEDRKADQAELRR